MGVNPGSEPVCVVTRMIFPRWRSIPGALFRFRRLARAGRRQVPGLVETHFRIKRGPTLLIFSLWRDELSVIQFTTLESHVNAVRWMIDQRGEVWSGVFRLSGTSSMSKPWIGTVRHWQPLAGHRVDEP